MSNKWYVVASSAEARIYQWDKTSSQVVCLIKLEHSANRMKGHELSSDRPGNNQSAGNGHGAYIEKHHPKEYEAENFAIEISHYLINKKNGNHFTNLVIAASPHFHGLLNKHFDKNLTSSISGNIKKDLTSVKEDELRSVLASFCLT